MDLRDIEYFAVIAEQRHIGRAAEVLGLGQPALSISLRRLEAAADCRLVERTAKGVVLTSAGQTLLDHVGRLRLAREDLAREIAELARGRSGSLRIGASPSNLLFVLPEVCRALLGDAPRLNVSVQTLDNEALWVALRNGDIDVVVGHAQRFRDPAIRQIILHEDEFVVFCAAAHRLARRKSLRLDELAAERWVASDTNAYSPWLSLHQFFGERGLPAPIIALTSPSSALNLRAVAGSDLVGISNKRNVLAAQSALQLKVLPVRDVSWKRAAVVAHRASAYVSPAARRFIEAMQATVPDGSGSAPGSPRARLDVVRT